MKLSPCATCTRLVRATDTTCPFCGASVAHSTESTTAPRLRRGLMLVGAAAITVGCGTSQALYGAPAPPEDAAADGAKDAAADGPVAAYGGPPIDSGVDAAKDAAPDGPIAAYGGPPLDGGKD